MAGQVGGVSIHKKRLLTLQPDYVLKPLQTDHRGLRELTFYEAVLVASRTPSVNNYSAFLTARDRSEGTTFRVSDIIDTVAMALAIFLQDPVVVESEISLREAWKMVKKEVDAMVKIAKFTAPYYGIVGQRKVLSSAYGLSDEAHLLLQDVTINFSKPCVIDLKMGTQSYEPDASVEKRTREFNKYPQQALFGFRIVGMRYYEPNDPAADENGYIFIGKEYGRSLNSRDKVLSALRTLFSAGMDYDAPAPNNIESPEETPPQQNDTPLDFVELETEAVSASGIGKGKSQATSKMAKVTLQGTTQETDEEPTEIMLESFPAVEMTLAANSNAGKPHTIMGRCQRSLRAKSIANLMLQFRSLRRWFDENESMLRFYASSLLIVFEGDMSKTSGADSGVITLKMIDFGRVRRRSMSDITLDDGYRTGLRTLHDLFQELLDEEKERLNRAREERNGS